MLIYPDRVPIPHTEWVFGSHTKVALLKSNAVRNVYFSQLQKEYHIGKV